MSEVGDLDHPIKPRDFGDVNIPSDGLGSIPGVEGPTGFAAPEVPAADVPDTPPGLLDGLIEHFDAPGLPEANPVIPLDPANHLLATVVDGTGGLATMAPLDVLQTLPLGYTTKLTLRFVGDSGSIWSNTGIPGVSVRVEAQDPLGLVKTQTTQNTNQNGYAIFTVPSQGVWKVTATHEKYLPVQGTGATSIIGGESAQEYQMRSDAGNPAEDFVRNNSLWLILLLAALVVLFVLYRKMRKGDRK